LFIFYLRNNQIDSDVTSIDTNFDNQTIKIDLNVNQKNFSYHSSISNLDVTIPSNLSSSIDLEQFDCFSTTSNISEYLNTN
jgi:D-alanyl-D-alanine dipeptidase